MYLMQILLVEDNDGDVLLIKDAFEEAKVNCRIHAVGNGEKAVQFLNREGKYTDSVKPNLIILDINLPRLNGHEVLQFIKSSVQLCQIPVIMFTTSSSDKDITESYRKHANCYITKPVEVDDFTEAILQIEKFWFHLATLPCEAV